jgi:hypothetical protein
MHSRSDLASNDYACPAHFAVFGPQYIAYGLTTPRAYVSITQCWCRLFCSGNLGVPWGNVLHAVKVRVGIQWLRMSRTLCCVWAQYIVYWLTTPRAYYSISQCKCRLYCSRGLVRHRGTVYHAVKVRFGIQ